MIPINASRISSVSVIMPTYNEAGNIVALMESSIHELKTAGLEKIEIIVVDDMAKMFECSILICEK